MEEKVTNGEEDLVEVEAGVKVEGELWDLNRPLEGDCTLALIKFGVRGPLAMRMHMQASLFLHSDSVRLPGLPSTLA